MQDLDRQIFAATRRHDFQTAAGLAKRILTTPAIKDFKTKPQRALELAGYQFFALDFGEAAKPLKKYAGTGDDQNGVCELTLAKIEAQSGRFAKALAWLDRYEYVVRNGCVPCSVKKLDWVCIYRAIWRASQLPANDAASVLGRMVEGKYRAPNPDGPAPDWFDRPSQDEARLALASLLLRSGDRKGAEQSYQALASSPYFEVASLAASHLAALKAVKART